MHYPDEPKYLSYYFFFLKNIPNFAAFTEKGAINQKLKLI